MAALTSSALPTLVRHSSRRTSGSASAFTVQDASSNQVLGIDTNAEAINLGATGSLALSTTVNIANSSSNAQTIAIGNTVSSTAITLKAGTGGIVNTVGSSTTAFKIQDASNNNLLNIDTTSTTITIGNSGNTLTFTPAGGLVAAGTAQHTKTILLSAEYAGGVLDALSDASCSSANAGTMTSAYDSTNRMNNYNWTSASGTAQCYDVVVQVPVPADFSSWSGTPSIQLEKDATGTAAYAIQIIPSSGSDANYGSYVSPGTLTTSWGNMATSALSGTYTAGNYMTIKVRMTSTSGANVKLGNISLTYNSKF